MKWKPSRRYAGEPCRQPSRLTRSVLSRERHGHRWCRKPPGSTNRQPIRVVLKLAPSQKTLWFRGCGGDGSMRDRRSCGILEAHFPDPPHDRRETTLNSFGRCLKINETFRGLVKRAEEWKGSSIREYAGVDAGEPQSRCGLEIGPGLAGMPADPAERDPHPREEATKHVCGSRPENSCSRYRRMQNQGRCVSGCTGRSLHHSGQPSLLLQAAPGVLVGFIIGL